MKNSEIRLGSFTFDPKLGVLRDASGEKIDLRHQSTEVLRELARHPNEVVERRQFQSNVWDDRQGSDEGLVQCIAEIRRVLGDTDKAIVETIPRKGYRLVADLPPEPDTRPKRTLLAVALATLVAAAIVLTFWGTEEPNAATKPTIAVLPFENLSPATETYELADAVSDSIITSLARYPEFSVIARQSSFRFRDGTRDIPEIGEALGADYIVQGSHALTDGTLQISVQLVNTHDSTLQLVDALEVPVEELFEANEQIAFRVANTVSGSVVTLNAQKERRPGEVDALVMDNRARLSFRSGPSEEKWQAALTMYDGAIESYPDVAWGYLGKALMLRTGVRFGWELDGPDTVLDEAKALALKSIELSPENYMTHFTLGRVLMQEGDIVGSIAALERSSDLNPSSAMVFNALGQSYIYAGDTEAVKHVTDKVAAIDPLPGVLTIWVRAWGQWLAEDCDSALETVNSMPTLPITANKLKAVIHLCAGETETAKSLFDEYLAKYPDWSRQKELDTNASNWTTDGPRDRWLAALSEAGMPD